MYSLSVAIFVAVLAIARLGQGSFQAGQIFIPGGGTVQPPGQAPSCSARVEGTYKLNSNCSGNFFKYCAAQRELGSSGGHESYLPNCVGQRTQIAISNDLQRYGPMLEYFSNRTEPKVVRCMKLLIPFLCGTYYPIVYQTRDESTNKPRIVKVTPCFDYCQHMKEICSEAAGLPIVGTMDCDSMFNHHCSPTDRSDPDVITSCMESPALVAPSCFQEFNSTMSDITNCTGIAKCSRKKPVRTTISKKNFDKFKFAAQVKVLDEVHLSEPKNTIAYKVKIVNDYYLDCKTCDKYSFNLTSGSETYVLSTDSLTDCNERCVQNKIEIGGEYLMMGTQIKSKQVKDKCGGNVWVLDSTRGANSVLYPWGKIKKGKRSKIAGWVNEFYACTKTCKRKNNRRAVIGA